MYTSAFASSRHGMITTPMIPVISPPSAKVIFFGKALEKSYDGLTTLAARFAEIVASTSATSATTTTAGEENRDARVAGSQMTSPNSTAPPDVVRVATIAMNDIV